MNMLKAKVYKTFEMPFHLLPESTQGAGQFGAMQRMYNQSSTGFTNYMFPIPLSGLDPVRQGWHD